MHIYIYSSEANLALSLLPGHLLAGGRYDAIPPLLVSSYQLEGAAQAGSLVGAHQVQSWDATTARGLCVDSRSHMHGSAEIPRNPLTAKIIQAWGVKSPQEKP